LLELPTNKLGKLAAVLLVCKICSSTAGAILQPHPAPWEYCVSLTAWLIMQQM
jgi:hypothetical protein